MHTFLGSLDRKESWIVCFGAPELFQGCSRKPQRGRCSMPELWVSGLKALSRLPTFWGPELRQPDNSATFLPGLVGVCGWQSEHLSPLATAATALRGGGPPHAQVTVKSRNSGPEPKVGPMFCCQESAPTARIRLVFPDMLSKVRLKGRVRLEGTTQNFLITTALHSVVKVILLVPRNVLQTLPHSSGRSGPSI